LGSSLFLKGYRRLQAGIGSEVEVGRFLTEVARFPNAVQVAGVIEYQGKADAAPMALALLQGYVENQGDGWRYTLDYLERFLDECRTDPSLDRPPAEAHAAYLSLVQILGQRTGEMHKALATPSGDPAFDPEPVTDEDLAQWVERAHQEAEATLALIERQRAVLDEGIRAEAEMLLNKREQIAQYFRTAVPSHLEAIKTRYHGDYHLGQVLLKENDFILIDFEGEPARPIAERRQKHSPLRDVAGMLRSFNYAAFSALAQVGGAQPGDSAAIEPFARQWEGKTWCMFVEAYRDAVRDSRLYPDWNEARLLLDLFLLEKACYELRYELGNRPDWVRVPLRGILELLAQGE
jgi:maltose alpha-D-glucosyltransferase/alpha-amylase